MQLFSNEKKWLGHNKLIFQLGFQGNDQNKVEPYTFFRNKEWVLLTNHMAFMTLQWIWI